MTRDYSKGSQWTHCAPLPWSSGSRSRHESNAGIGWVSGWGAGTIHSVTVTCTAAGVINIYGDTDSTAKATVHYRHLCAGQARSLPAWGPRNFPDKSAARPDFAERFVADDEIDSPFLRFLCQQRRRVGPRNLAALARSGFVETANRPP